MRREKMPITFYDEKECARMTSEMFFTFFKTYSYLRDIDDEVVDEVSKYYKRAKSIRKKRIRQKKEKDALQIMHHLLFSD